MKVNDVLLTCNRIEDVRDKCINSNDILDEMDRNTIADLLNEYYEFLISLDVNMPKKEW